jgi:hypothetical protein
MPGVLPRASFSIHIGTWVLVLADFFSRNVTFGSWAPQRRFTHTTDGRVTGIYRTSRVPTTSRDRVISLSPGHDGHAEVLAWWSGNARAAIPLNGAYLAPGTAPGSRAAASRRATDARQRRRSGALANQGPGARENQVRGCAAPFSRPAVAESGRIGGRVARARGWDHLTETAGTRPTPDRRRAQSRLMVVIKERWRYGP